jgi:hypothetical protein
MMNLQGFPLNVFLSCFFLSLANQYFWNFLEISSLFIAISSLAYTLPPLTFFIFTLVPHVYEIPILTFYIFSYFYIAPTISFIYTLALIFLLFINLPHKFLLFTKLLRSLLLLSISFFIN